MTPPSVCLSLVVPSLDATHAVAGALASLSRPGDVVVLAGEMGAGKTAFAQGFGRALGVTEPITSPTFTLVHTYDTPAGPLHHADVYRLDQYAEVADLALGELAEFNGIVLVEWGDVVSTLLGDHLEVRLELVDDAPSDVDVVVDARMDTRRDVEGDAPVDGLAGVDGVAGVDDGFEEPPTERRIRITPSGLSWARRWSTVVERISRVDLAMPQS